MSLVGALYGAMPARLRSWPASAHGMRLRHERFSGSFADEARQAAERDTWSAADWSDWTKPALAEGWIKRVLAGSNPFNQRINDLFNNRVNSDVSIITQAGRRWEGYVALTLDTTKNCGLFEV